MNATDKNNVATAEAYYLAMAKKDVSGVAQFLHPDVEFVAPLGKSKGKEALVEASEKFVTLFSSLTICAKFGEGDQAVIVYELQCPDPIGNMRAVSLMSFQDSLISRIELFYDPSPFV